MKHCIILGTRPEIIKLSSLIREFEKNKKEYFIIHTNQHYSKEMDKIIFEELELPNPKFNLNVGSLPQGKQTGQMIEKIEEILVKEDPDIIYVQGDTNSVMAGALAASKLGIKIAHIEAGLRSYDRAMPEEINRIVTDHICDYLFPPTKKSADILKKEGIDSKKIHIVGNTVVDAVNQNLKIAIKKSKLLGQLGLSQKNYFLLTMHRPSNVDSKENIESIFKGLSQIYQIFKTEIIFPIHPRTKKQIDLFKIKVPKGITIINPLGFLEMLELEQNAKLILTDSGGIQEEACILNVPCVTLRDNTERPETVEVGASLLAGNDPKKIFSFAKKMLDSSNAWENPFGDGKAAKKILNLIDP